jgi:general secretion pathway protein F
MADTGMAPSGPTTFVAPPPLPVPPADPGHLRFRWTAVEAVTGRERQGEMAADSAWVVRSGLRRLGLEPLVVEPVGGTTQVPTWLEPWLAPWRRLALARQRRNRRLARANLYDAIATLLQAGVPLEQALAALAGSPVRPPAERQLLAVLRDRIRQGTAVAAACAEHPGWFDALDLALLDAGQRAGDLPNTLASLSGHHQRAGASGQQFFVALAYPALLLVAGVAAWEFMAFVTLPKLVAMIVQARHAPPTLTMWVMGLGQGLAVWWPAVVVAIVGGVWAFRRWAATVPLDSRRGRWLFANPYARWRTGSRVAQLAETLARLRRAGLPLTEALAAAADAVDERALRGLLATALTEVRAGRDLSAVVGSSRLLDPEFAQLVQLGEQSGELTTMLERIAERYQRDAERTGERVAAILGPAAIIVLAFLIGLVVLASILPLVQLGDLV